MWLFSVQLSQAEQVSQSVRQAVGPVTQVENQGHPSTAGKAQTELWKDRELGRAPGRALLFIYTPV